MEAKLRPAPTELAIPTQPLRSAERVGPLVSPPATRKLRVQLWSYNYEPEPTGIGPVSAVWARAMRDRGHQIEVVAAHPHYPSPQWGKSVRPYVEDRDGIRVLRLPLWPGRASKSERLRQELGYAAVQGLASVALSTPDMVVAVSPCFPALAPAMLNASARRRPWALWLQDILPDGAATTGLVDPGPVLRAARWLEATAYRSASHIFVVSDAFRTNLRNKGVPGEKLTLLRNPITRPRNHLSLAPCAGPPRLLSMGNIGHSQGLVELVRDFEASEELDQLKVHFALAGVGVAANDVTAAIRTDRVEMLGLLNGEDLDLELGRATLAVVSQRKDMVEFNLPSRLMNFMAHGLPVIASVHPDSEVAHILRESGAGWVADSSQPGSFSAAVCEALSSPIERRHRALAGFEFARRHFTPANSAAIAEAALIDVVDRSEELRSGTPFLMDTLAATGPLPR